jgi:leader peptidase (prepilin peptidase)/N-methyltransferase
LIAGSPVLSDPAIDPRPNWWVVLVGTTVVALVSLASLPWPIALLSIALGALMIVGADVDARSYLLPDMITAATVVSGLVAAAALEPLAPGEAVLGALARAIGTAGALGLVRFGYAKLRGIEGLGLGDVKLAAGIGAWLPLDHIPFCFAIATGAALLYSIVAHLRGTPMDRTSRLPFGAFLCPSLWLVFYAGVVS